MLLQTAASQSGTFYMMCIMHYRLPRKTNNRNGELEQLVCGEFFGTPIRVRLLRAGLRLGINGSRAGRTGRAGRVQECRLR